MNSVIIILNEAGQWLSIGLLFWVAHVLIDSVRQLQQFKKEELEKFQDSLEDDE